MELWCSENLLICSEAVKYFHLNDILANLEASRKIIMIAETYNRTGLSMLENPIEHRRVYFLIERRFRIIVTILLNCGNRWNMLPSTIRFYSSPAVENWIRYLKVFPFPDSGSSSSSEICWPRSCYKNLECYFRNMWTRRKFLSNYHGFRFLLLIFSMRVQIILRRRWGTYD